jgi:hypothetical protein
MEGVSAYHTSTHEDGKKCETQQWHAHVEPPEDVQSDGV